MRHLSGFPVLRICAVALVGFASVAGLARAQDATWRVSVDAAGVQGDDQSHAVSLSPDGRFVVFSSKATNLVAGDTNGKSDTFVRDRLSGAIERISVDSAGTEGNQDSFGGGAFSADARFVVFNSYAMHLVPGDTNGASDAFVRDRLNGTTERVSVGPAGVQGDWTSIACGISADSRYVSFWSEASNLVPGDTNDVSDVFVHDRQTGTTERVSVDSAGTQGDDASFTNSISADGRYVAFHTWAHLVAGDKNRWSEVYLHDRQTRTTQRVSVDWTGSTGSNGECYDPVLSADGRFVAFHSGASNLVNGDSNNCMDVFVRDLTAGITDRVSVDSAGLEGDRHSVIAAISADGRFVSFTSEATNLVGGDTNGIDDVFRHDRLTGTTERVSVNPHGWQAYQDCMSVGHALSADGRFVVFETADPGLVPSDTNMMWDTFVHGPYLTLDADPSSVGAGATLTLTTKMGMSFGTAMLAAIDLDGTPLFVPITFGTFDADGTWAFAATVPTGLSGHVATLTSFGFVSPSSVKRSNDAPITFQ